MTESSGTDTRPVSIRAHGRLAEVYSGFDAFAEDHSGADPGDPRSDLLGASLELLDEPGPDGAVTPSTGVGATPDGTDWATSDDRGDTVTHAPSQGIADERRAVPVEVT